MEEIEFEHVDWASAGSIGDPGHRVFMIQGRKENATISVLVEKQQIELLANQSLEFLDSIQQEFPEERVATPYEFEMAGSVEPIEPLFRAQSMGLIFDPDSMLITLELREFPFDDDQLDDEHVHSVPLAPQDDEHVIRLTMTRSQLRAMAVRGTESVLAGREVCPLCQNPMDSTGHLCPRLN